MEEEIKQKYKKPCACLRCKKKCPICKHMQQVHGKQCYFSGCLCVREPDIEPITLEELLDPMMV